MSALETHPDAMVQRLERELALADARVADAEARLQDLVYVASHDLVEPLRMVKSFLQLLERRNAGTLDDRSQEFLHYAIDGAERMKALIDDLLLYSRTGSAELQRTELALGTVVDGVLASLRRLIDEQRATVRVEQPLPEVEGDPALLGQLLANLVANAVTFHPGERGNTVVVRAERDEAAWRIAVVDDGIGFDPQHTARIFKPFQRLHARDEYTGSGIGLAICQRIAERHGGTVVAESALGGGATFTVVLPDPAAETAPR